jgi:hypothetical protein
MLQPIYASDLNTIHRSRRIKFANFNDIGLFNLCGMHTFSTADNFRPRVAYMGVSFLETPISSTVGYATQFGDTVRVDHIPAVGHIFQVGEFGVGLNPVNVIDFIPIWATAEKRSGDELVDPKVFLASTPKRKAHGKIAPCTNPRFQYRSDETVATDVADVAHV